MSEQTDDLKEKDLTGPVKGDFPITESVCERTIALPFYNNLTKDQVSIVCKTLKEILDTNRS